MNTVVSCGDGDVSARHSDLSGGVDRIICGCDIQSAGFNVKISVFLFIGGHKAIISRVHGNGRIFDTETVVAPDSIRRSCYCNVSAGDDQVIVGGYSMSVFCGHRQAAAAVDRKIIVGEDCAVCAVFQRLIGVSGTAGEYILTALRECQEDFVSLIHPDAGIIAAVDLNAGQLDEHLRGVVSVHRDITVGERTCHNIVTGVRDHHVPVVGICAVPGDVSPIPGQCDHCGT